MDYLTKLKPTMHRHSRHQVSRTFLKENILLKKNTKMAKSKCSNSKIYAISKIIKAAHTEKTD